MPAKVAWDAQVTESSARGQMGSLGSWVGAGATSTPTLLPWLPAQAINPSCPLPSRRWARVMGHLLCMLPSCSFPSPGLTGPPVPPHTPSPEGLLMESSRRVAGRAAASPTDAVTLASVSLLPPPAQPAHLPPLPAARTPQAGAAPILGASAPPPCQALAT